MMNGYDESKKDESMSNSQHHPSDNSDYVRDQAKLIKKLKHVVNSLKQQNEELRQSKDENSEEKVEILESQVKSLEAEKEGLSHLIYGLRGCVDQTSLVLERSQARFIRLHDQLSSTRDSLTSSQLFLHPPSDVMTVHELYQENEELRNTVDFIRSHLDSRPSTSPVPPTSTLNISHGYHSSRSLSPSRHRPTTLDGTDEKDRLTLENKDLRERLGVAEKKMRSAQMVKRRYEQALERANSIIDQRSTQPTESESPLPIISKQQLASFMTEMKAVEDERDQYRSECVRLSESERTALEECERVHIICHELQALLDTTTAALTERASAYDSSTHQLLELEAKLEEVLIERDLLQSQVSQLSVNNSDSYPVPQVAPQPAVPTNIVEESDIRRYSELVRNLESQFRNSQIQLESVASERHRIEGLYRAIQSECAELRNSLSRYEATNRDLRSQLSDREGRVQALESAKSLLSNAMFKTEQENKQLLWQLKSVQGADERLGRTLEQLHQLQSQSMAQGEALRDSRVEASRLGSLLQSTQASLHSLISERATVFAEIRNISSTCGELANLVA